MNFFRITLLASLCFLAACSDYKMIQHERDEEFFSVYKNPAGEIGQAGAKIETIKLLLTSEDFPIRLAIYDNGKFYYQVDELGTGIGDWVYEKGGLRLTTRRKVFDMNFYLTALKPEGNELVVRFFDRHGFNEYPLEFRNPNSVDQNGNKPGKLREFRSSIKDI